MPARHLSRLIEELYPGVSVRSLEERAGVPPQTVAKYTKPGAAYNRLPHPDQIRVVARVLRCRVSDVVRAFNLSLDDPLPLDQLPDDELELLAVYRAMGPGEQRHLRAIAETLSKHSPEAQPTLDAGAGRREPRPKPKAKAVS